MGTEILDFLTINCAVFWDGQEGNDGREAEVSLLGDPIRVRGAGKRVICGLTASLFQKLR